MEVHKKFSIPLSCIFFGLLALPLGITSHRAVKSRGFAVGIMIVTAYYLLRIGGEALVETGRLVSGCWCLDTQSYICLSGHLPFLYGQQRDFSFPDGLCLLLAKKVKNLRMNH